MSELTKHRDFEEDLRRTQLIRDITRQPSLQVEKTTRYLAAVLDDALDKRDETALVNIGAVCTYDRDMRQTSILMPRSRKLDFVFFANALIFGAGVAVLGLAVQAVRVWIETN